MSNKKNNKNNERSPNIKKSNRSNNNSNNKSVDKIKFDENKHVLTLNIVFDEEVILFFLKFYLLLSI